MKFVLQLLTITNCDAKSRMGDSAKKQKHGEMLPNTIRAIICGSSIGKTNVLISLKARMISRTYTSTRNRYNSQNIDISKIYLRLSIKSASLRSSTTAMSVYRARHAQILSLMMWHATSRMR